MFGTTRILSFAIILLLTSFNALAGAGGGGVGPPPPPPKPTLNNVAATINEDTNKYLNPGINGQGRGITGRRINSQPANGSASWSGNNLYFKPKANWCGRTTFRYSVATSAGWSSTRTATMTVRCVVDKPWVGNKNGTVQEDSSITLSPGISLDGGTISARYIDTQPRNGSVHWSGNRLIYTPKGNYCGSDSFRYSLRTQAGKSNVATSSITVACVVDIPIVGDVSGSLDEDTSKILSPSIFTDGAPITKYIIKAAALRGTATWNGNSLKYVPRENFCGTDTFTYQIQTSGGLSNAGTASLTVNCIVDKPTIDDVVAEFNEDTPYTFNPTIWTDGAAITQRTVDQAPSNGSLVWVGNNIKYTPNSNYCGSDTFKYSVSTSAGKSELGNGYVTVKCLVDLPNIGNILETLDEDSSITRTPTVTLDGGTITRRDITNSATNGTATWESGKIKYVPNPNYCGVDSFKYRLSTEAGYSNIATATFNVTCKQDIPTITGPGSINLSVLDTQSVVFNANDVDGDNLTAKLTTTGKSTLPSWIQYTFDGSKANVTFSPGENDPGDYRIELSINDGNGGINVHDIRVNVRDNRPVSLTAILTRTFSLPQVFNDKEDNNLNGIHFENVKDSAGNLLTGTINVTVTVDASVTVPVIILGMNMQPGLPTPASYTFVKPGVIDISAIPSIAGQDGLIEFKIQFNVN